MDKKPTSHVTQGRVAKPTGLSANATLEDMILAANFLYATMHGQGAIAQGESIPSLGLKATMPLFNISITQRLDEYFLTATPRNPVNSNKELVNVGMFMGELVALKKSHHAITNEGIKHSLFFKNKADLITTLNRYAAQWPDVYPLYNPSNSKSALQWLADMPQQGRRI